MGFLEKQKSNRNGTVQTIAYDGSVQATNPFGAQTYQVRLEANSACHYQIGNGTLTASVVTDPFLPSGFIEYVTVTPGQNIAAPRRPCLSAVTQRGSPPHQRPSRTASSFDIVNFTG